MTEKTDENLPAVVTHPTPWPHLIHAHEVVQIVSKEDNWAWVGTAIRTEFICLQ